MPQVPDVPEAFLFYTETNLKPDAVQAPVGVVMRVLLADDNKKVRFALTALLQRQPEVVVVGEANDINQLMAVLRSDKPDLLLVDWSLPGLAETGSVPALRESYPELMIVALSGRPELGQEALAAGADDFVSKIDPPETLIRAVDACVARLDERQAAVTTR
jgi:DNA-binding NarL/FixJ family response regulator